MSYFVEMADAGAGSEETQRKRMTKEQLNSDGAQTTAEAKVLRS